MSRSNAAERVANRARFDALHQCVNIMRLLSNEARDAGHLAKACFLETAMEIVIDEMRAEFPAYTEPGDVGGCQP